MKEKSNNSQFPILSIFNSFYYAMSQLFGCIELDCVRLAGYIIGIEDCSLYIHRYPSYIKDQVMCSSCKGVRAENAGGVCCMLTTCAFSALADKCSLNMTGGKRF